LSSGYSGTKPNIIKDPPSKNRLGDTMKKFIVLYHANQSAMEQMGKSTPEETKKGMEKWHEWAKSCGDGLVDLGNPLGNCQKINSQGKSPSEVTIVGYSILQAEDMEKAKALLKGHPHLGWNEGCDIEVHECLPLPA
jgi:hypothetical protein